MTDSKPSKPSCRIGVDIGGTFTDVVLEARGKRYTLKILTTPEAPELAVFEGVSSVTAEAGVEPRDVDVVIHGTTLATNALIERKGARTALLTTEGFRDVLAMGTESRFDQYDLDIVKPLPLVRRRDRFTVRERVSAAGNVLLPLDEESVRRAADEMVRGGIESVAVGFMHSFAFPDHESQAASLLRETIPDLSISLSSAVSPEINEYQRFSTTCANAYLQPMVSRYLREMERGLQDIGFICPLLLMLSGGNLTDVATASRFPVRLVESGPAGGTVFAAQVAQRHRLKRVVSFDMGGTTAKLSLIDDATLPSTRTFEAARAHRFKPGSGLPLRVPVVEMVEIGAGGGSVARVDTLRRILVGPESAGAVPGPACYDRGGRSATVTDADLLLGRLSPEGFAGGRVALKPDLAAARLTSDIALPLSVGEAIAAAGVVEIVDENMANAAREHASESGKTLVGRTLVAMGGCAPLHAARLAQKLGIERIVVPESAGVGSALGFLSAPIAYEIVGTAHQRLSQFDPGPVNERFSVMSREAHRVVSLGAPDSERIERRQAFMRYVGQGQQIPVNVPLRPLTPEDGVVLRDSHEEAYRSRYGRSLQRVEVEVMGWMVSVVADREEVSAANTVRFEEIPPCERDIFDPARGVIEKFDVYLRNSLTPGVTVPGPAAIAEPETTTMVPRGFRASVDASGDIVVERDERSSGEEQ